MLNQRESQAKRILRHLESAPITAYECAMQYGIICLAERIRDLRKKGHIIHMKKIKSSKSGARFGRYTLIQKADID